ncbi:autotransporter outer membrane beta-barrel domain-containing protein [Enterobacter asburiae]|nr:autotransporter outer membrane beta-barrel domain-containing protein [Enterobacter asburiae]
MINTLPGFGINSGGNAFYIQSSDSVTFTDNNNSTITAGMDGFSIYNTGPGAVNLTTTGQVTATDRGIDIHTLGSDVHVNAADVTGGLNGIYIENSINAGNITVNVSGSAIGRQNYGIYSSALHDLTIKSTNAHGFAHAVWALSNLGKLDIASTGALTSTGDFSMGVRADNFSGTDVNINVNDVSGSYRGISVTNAGTGSSVIKSSGKVIAFGVQGTGINALNAGKDLTIDANVVSGTVIGIDAQNDGTGALSVITRGAVTGTAEYGIRALNTGNGPVDVTISTGSSVQGGLAGIDVVSMIQSNVNNAGTISNLSGQSSDLAIKMAGASSAILNQGVIQGTMLLSDGGNTLTNASGGRWDTSGGTINFGSLASANSVVNNGNIITANGVSSGPLQTTTFDNVGTFSNAGTLSMANGRAGDITAINGNYVGNGGVLHLDTVLEGDDSATDKLLVNGDTSGTTFVVVDNLGGSGVQRVEGIEIVQVNGNSGGEFVNNGRIVTGAYDYHVTRGQGRNSSNWYLTSQISAGPVDPVVSAVRPESGSYTANMAAANTLFITRLHERLGETQYTDALTGEKKVTSMWMRHAGGHNSWSDSSGQLDTQSNHYVLQIGGEIASLSSNGFERLHLGVMSGYGHSDSNTRSSSTGYRSDGSVSGYSAGVYATWYSNDEMQQGAYADSWAQYSLFDNTVKGNGVQSESYKSSGITGSLELGYTHKLSEFTGSKGSRTEWLIQPQAQAIWMGVKANDHVESNGTRVTGEGDGNVQTRLGLRTFLKSHRTTNEDKVPELQPFLEVNWIHNTRDFGTTMDGVSIRQEGARNLGEIKTGIEGKVAPQLNIWGNVGVQVGNNGYNDSSAMIGIRYNF